MKTPRALYRELISELEENIPVEPLPETVEQINSRSDQVHVIDNPDRMSEEEQKAFLEAHSDITLEDGAYINKKGEVEYEEYIRTIFPPKMKCPDCGGITTVGLDYCSKCGGMLS